MKPYGSFDGQKEWLVANVVQNLWSNEVSMRLSRIVNAISVRLVTPGLMT
jgi:hypothetical protein